MQTKKRMTAIIMIVCMLLVTVLDAFPMVNVHAASDNNSEEEPTPIYTITDLSGIRINPSGKYILMNDIDLTEATKKGGEWDQGNGWTPIEEFSGEFDGNGYRIIGMNIYGTVSTDKVGLFGSTYGATIKNLGMTKINIDVTNKYVGGIVGYDKDCSNTTTISNCYCDGNIKNETSSSYTAGICSYADHSIAIENCINSCTIFSSTSSAGILGRKASCILLLKNCYNIGKVTDSYAIYGEYYYVPDDTITNNYYLIGNANSGSPRADSAGQIVGLTETQMKYKTSYPGFDFDNTWEIDPYCNYPYPQLKNNRIVRLTKMEMVSRPTKTEYKQGEALDLTGATVKLTYENDISTTIVITDDMLKPYDMNKIGKQTITVSMSDKTTQFEIQVNEIPVTEVNLDQTNVNLNKGLNLQLNASIVPENASFKDITWTSSDPEIATVSETGLVMAKSKGTVTITATAKSGVSKECTVNVTVPCVLLLFKNYEFSLHPGDIQTIETITSPVDSTDHIAWTSSNPEIATVSDGIITALNAGEATITAKTDSGLEKSCHVVVKQTLEGFFFNGLANVNYTGAPITQEFVITDATKILRPGIDYSVSYSNNINPGIATVTVTGMGFYEGSISQTFEIKQPVVTTQPPAATPAPVTTQAPVATPNSTVKTIFTVAFTDRGQILSTQSIPLHGSAIPPKPRRSGYLLVGWDQSTFNITTDLNITAKWKKVKVSKGAITSLKNTKSGKLTIKFKKISGAKKYEIRYSLKSNMKAAKITTSSSTTKTITKLKKKKKYYVQIRAYSLDSTGKKIYGDWSNKKSITIKK